MERLVSICVNVFASGWNSPTDPPSSAKLLRAARTRDGVTIVLTASRGTAAASSERTAEAVEGGVPGGAIIGARSPIKFVSIGLSEEPVLRAVALRMSVEEP